MAFKVKELEGALGEVIEALGIELGEKIIEEVEKDYQVWCITSYYYLPDYHINLHVATLMDYEEDTKDYEVTESMYLVFDGESKEFLYCEIGGSLESCLYNYIHNIVGKKDFEFEDVYTLNCTYILDKGQLIDSYHPTDP